MESSSSFIIFTYVLLNLFTKKIIIDLKSPNLAKHGQDHILQSPGQLTSGGLAICQSDCYTKFLWSVVTCRVNFGMGTNYQEYFSFLLLLFVYPKGTQHVYLVIRFELLCEITFFRKNMYFSSFPKT